MGLNKFNIVVRDFAKIKGISNEEAWEILVKVMCDFEDEMKAISERRNL